MSTKCGLRFLKNVSLHRIYFLYYSQSFFVRSGGIDLGHSDLRSAGLDGTVRSRTSAGYTSPSAANNYYFYINATESRASHGPYPRYFGFPVRCLVY